MDKELGLTRNRVFGELVRSPHGKLEEYLPIGKKAANEDPEFFAHLIAWNSTKGQVRDAKVALPLIAIDSLVPLAGNKHSPGMGEFKDNALAHLATLSPRDLMRGVRFAKSASLAGRRQAIPKLVKSYLLALEANRGRWDRAAVQHRRTMQELYAFCHVKPSEFSKAILFDGIRPPGSIFDIIASLKEMTPIEAAGVVITKKIPFLIAAPALGAKLKDKDTLAALIGRMTPAEVTSHMKMLEKLGVKHDPTLRGALESALNRVTAGTSSTLKMSKAAEALGDEELKEKVLATQSRKLDKSTLGGNWLIAADRSGSMSFSIEIAKQVAAILARLAGGNVHLVFFNNAPEYYDVTRKSLEEINKKLVNVRALGGTSIGVAARYAATMALEVDGVAIISDGGENAPPLFSQAYRELVAKLGKEVPVYLYKVQGDPDTMTGDCRMQGIEVHEFQVSSSTDYYSLETLAKTMRTNQYSLVDEIMETPLLTVSQVLSRGGEVRRA
jgi:hypothetical protein